MSTVMEALAIKSSSDKAIWDLRIRKKEMKVLFADGMIIYVENPNELIGKWREQKDNLAKWLELCRIHQRRLFFFSFN